MHEMCLRPKEPCKNSKHSDVLFKAMLASEKLSGQSAVFDTRLQPDHIFVTFPLLEMGVVKIMKGMIEGVTEEEPKDYEYLLKTEWPELYPTDDEDALNTDSCTSPSSFETLLASSQKRPHSETALTSKYIDLSSLSPNTVIVESLFSKCSRVMTTNHKHMIPCLFQTIVCLRETKEYWDVHLVQDMVAGLWDTVLDHDYGEVVVFEMIDPQPNNFNDSSASEW
jgi:hypothetical protein